MIIDFLVIKYIVSKNQFLKVDITLNIFEPKYYHSQEEKDSIKRKKKSNLKLERKFYEFITLRNDAKLSMYFALSNKIMRNYQNS